MNRLMLCAGDVRREGWQTLDADPRREPTFVSTIPPLPGAVKAIAWDEIEWIHGVTSLYPWDAETVLGELRGVLAPGGKLVLEQPDFNIAARRLEWIFGDPSFQNPLHMNKWAYTPESLSKALNAAGFSRLAILRAIHHDSARDFRIEAFA